MRKVLSLFLLLLCPMAALADGMVVPTFAFPANVTIPDQRALIYFSNGTERLVIETRFAGAGTNFAWIVPFPSQPSIEEATTGLFPTLGYLFRPKVIHNIYAYYGWILFGTVLLTLIVFLRGMVITPVRLLVIVFILFLLAAVLMPALGGPKMRSMGISGRAVEVLEQRTIGAFEIATIQSRDAKGLRQWLMENEFYFPTNVASAMDDYVREGWVFVASKVRRDLSANATNVLQPLSFTFKTDKAVYPMRLTGINSSRLKVELYVFGAARAEAEHFRTERATAANYPEKRGISWNHWPGNPDRLNISHPVLKQWTEGAAMGTKLVGNLSAAQMKKDIWIGWNMKGAKTHTLYSRKGAGVIAANWGSGIFGTGLLILTVIILVKHWPRKEVWRWVPNFGVVSACVGAAVYLSLPKMDVRTSRSGFGGADYSIYRALGETTATNLPAIREEMNAIVAKHDDWKNELLGGPIREEDSPGNYTIRETNGSMELIFYDSEGAEEVFPF